jgi:hypothetical protein
MTRTTKRRTKKRTTSLPPRRGLNDGDVAVLVERLHEHYNPWGALSLSPTEDLEKHPTVVEHVGTFSKQRDLGYHYGRVRYFAERFRLGWKSVDAIEVDNETANDRVLPLAVVLDGHHRMCGALVAGVKRMRVSYGGRIDVLRYLQGRTDVTPES